MNSIIQNNKKSFMEHFTIEGAIFSRFIQNFYSEILIFFEFSPIFRKKSKFSGPIFFMTS